MDEEKPLVTIITPTTGRQSLYRLNASLTRQGVEFIHLLLWDDVRESDFLYPQNSSPTLRARLPEDMNGVVGDNCFRHSIVLDGSMVQERAYGSALRAVGLMAATTQYVTFADDDVWYDPNHLKELLNAIKGKAWARTIRRVWSSEKCIGEDHFESVGELAITSHKMVDNNCMIFERRFGSSAACLYRETKKYNDDRLMYDFLMKYAKFPGVTEKCTVNQVCPERLKDMFEENCKPCDRTGEQLKNNTG